MKVVQILYSGLGGHGSVVFSMIVGDRQRVHDYHLIFYGVEPLLDEYRTRCEEHGIAWEYIKKNPGPDRKALKKLKTRLMEIHPNVVLLHNNALAHLLKPTCRRVHARLITIEHDPLNVKGVKEWLYSFLTGISSDKIIVLTERYRELLTRYFPWVSSRIHLIPNGIDLEYFKPAAGLQPAGTIGMASRMTPGKDHETLIQAISQMRQSGKTSFRVILAGDGVTRVKLQKLVNELQLDSTVEFAGMLSGDDFLKYLQSLELYVHSSHGETMSTVIMQAMACGLPVVASDVTGVNNLINDENGILALPEDAGDLAKKITEILEERELKSALGRAARAYAEEHFSNHTMFQKYNEIISA